MNGAVKMAEQSNAFNSSSSSSASVFLNLSQQGSSTSTASINRASATAATNTGTRAFPCSSAGAASTGGGGEERGGGGVVVVGFVGSRPTTDATHLINTIIDANVFGSNSNAKAKDLPPTPLKHHRISYYYHDASEDGDGSKGKGILYLLLSSSSSLLDSLLDDFESDHLRATLFMFSVCHVIVFLHEGLRFDTEILKKLRVLQAAKHAFSPFVRSQITPMPLPKSTSASLLQPKASSSPSISPPGRRAGRHSSSISLMSGSTSHTSALPGQCTPVILFVLSDDSCDGMNPSPNLEDLTEASFLGQPACSDTGSQKSSLTLKASGSVVMLARPTNKTEASLKKKLQTSLDVQVRFLIKKCRLLVGTEPSLRGSGTSNALPLFSLDASRAVILIDRSGVQRGHSLDFITGHIADAYNSKGGSDMSMFGTQYQALNHEEIQMIKDFVYRQSDTLRGRGGLPGNANCGSVAGVGMLAAAAAAAAASAAAGKPITAPELPSLENWLSSSILIIGALFFSEHGLLDESGEIKSLHSTAGQLHSQHTSQVGSRAAESALACLESSMDLNTKFSVSWCKRALPFAKEVYLNDLPACYPSSLHNAQLEKALSAFHSMVKGPAVQIFTKKLEDECTSIWTSGRQLCDAVSLTGKPCMHRRHTVKGGGSSLGNVNEEHSSGYFFHHACACGRSRCLWEDPFDFYSANVEVNCFANCEDILPTVVLPKGSNTSPLPPASWRLLRLGGARYYEPSKGLLQTGFCSGDNFLLKWTISLDKQKGNHSLATAAPFESPVSGLTIAREEKKKLDIGEFSKQVQIRDTVKQGKSAGMVCSDDTNISFGKGLPSFTMKKPFSEVVAGTVLVDSSLPNLKHNKHQKASPGNSGKQVGTIDQTDSQVDKADDCQEYQTTDLIEVQENLQNTVTNSEISCNPFLQIGSNLVPVNTSGSGNVQPNISRRQVVVYVGFEHECPSGHRFLLSPKHLTEFDSSCSTEVSERKHAENSNVLHEEMLPSPLRITSTVNDKRKSNRSTETAANCTPHRDRSTSFPGEGRGNFQSVPGLSISSSDVDELQSSLLRVRLDDDDSASCLLNRNLPIYMNCPHCNSSCKRNLQDIKFASTVSQLQRIFLVTIIPLFIVCYILCTLYKYGYFVYSMQYTGN